MMKRITPWLALAWLLAAVSAVGAPAQAQLRVLAYGDSNTWGWRAVADGKPVPRHGDAQRWAGVMQRALGPGYAVQVNGLIGRTLDADLSEGVGQLEGQDHNGRRRLALALAEAGPVNLLLLMLGTNDVIDELQRSPDDIAASLSALATIARVGTEAAPAAPALPRMLIVVPVPLGDTGRTPFKELFGPGAIEKSRQLAAAYRREAAKLGLPVFDAASVVPVADGIDGIHLSAAAHRRIGRALAAEIQRLARGAAAVRTACAAVSRAGC